jgi:hypothetical protein
MDIVSVDRFDRNSVVHNLDKNSCMERSNIGDDLEQNCQFSNIDLDSILAIGKGQSQMALTKAATFSSWSIWLTITNQCHITVIQ